MRAKLWALVFAAPVLVSTGWQPAASQEKPGHLSDRIVSTKTLAQRTATCKADCLPDEARPKGAGFHGHYRSYNESDPHLTSVEGRASYNKCVQSCLAPLPNFYVQRIIFGMGLSWFGQNKQNCLSCHISAQRDTLK